MPVECKCGTCGKSFFVKPSKIPSGRGKYCSRACFNRSKGEPPIKRKCERCGKEFVVCTSAVNRGKGIFCSIVCSKGHPKITRKCKTCGKEFQLHYKDAIRGDGQYCSKDCYFNRPDKPNRKILRICGLCKTEFPIYESELKSGQGRFCSRICHDNFQRGPNAPNWRGGISKVYCEKWTEELRESIREAFGRKCYLCPITEKENGSKLSVHHINFDKQSGCFGKRWNLVPLCKKHHAKSSNCRFEYFNLLINHWAMDSDINFRGDDPGIYSFSVVGNEFNN